MESRTNERTVENRPKGSFLKGMITCKGHTGNWDLLLGKIQVTQGSVENEVHAALANRSRDKNGPTCRQRGLGRS